MSDRIEEALESMKRAAVAVAEADAALVGPGGGMATANCIRANRAYERALDAYADIYARETVRTND